MSWPIDGSTDSSGSHYYVLLLVILESNRPTTHFYRLIVSVWKVLIFISGSFAMDINFGFPLIAIGPKRRCSYNHQAHYWMLQRRFNFGCGQETSLQVSFYMFLFKVVFKCFIIVIQFSYTADGASTMQAEQGVGRLLEQELETEFQRYVPDIDFWYVSIDSRLSYI